VTTRNNAKLQKDVNNEKQLWLAANFYERGPASRRIVIERHGEAIPGIITIANNVKIAKT
jgi:hypothetical protein